jgi:putative mRNA 3-end processing factor
MKRFKEVSTGIASGWMQLRGTRRRRNADRGFVMSDHADWPGLIEAVKNTGAEKIVVTHGYTDIFARYLNENGWNAITEKTEFGTEEEQETEEAACKHSPNFS